MQITGIKANLVVYPPLTLVRGAVKMYIVDVQYFQVPFLYSSFFGHKSHIKKITLSICVLILEHWHMYFIFEKGRDGCGVAIALCHFVIECKKLVNFTNVSASFDY